MITYKRLGEILLMKSFRRWKGIVIGFVFLIMSQNVERIFDDVLLQIIGNSICIVGALISFVISIRTDDKLELKNIVNNKWILFSLSLSIIIFIVIVALFCSSGSV